MIKVFFSYIHCADTEEQYIQDFNNLKSYISEEKKLNMKEINNIIKYCSYCC